MKKYSSLMKMVDDKAILVQNNDELVTLVENNRFYLESKSPRDPRVLDAMRAVDRKDFMVPQRKQFAYIDRPIYIKWGQNCSQPSVVGFMNDVLELEDGMKVLGIGTGCGYHAAIVLHLIGESGYLVTIEYNEELVEFGRGNLETHFGQGIEKRLRVVHGDGSIGFTYEAPFDRIYLTAGVNIGSFNPLILANQLKPEGILLFPKREGGLYKRIYKNGEMMDEQIYKGPRFVALQGRNT